ncbi:hypothetical protein ACOMHN_060805 [Nucella lapillus]
MLSGLSSLLFGSVGTDDATVDQTPASPPSPSPPSPPPSPLDTQDTDCGWVLVDRAGSEGQKDGEQLPREDPHEAGRQMVRGEGDSENNPAGPPSAGPPSTGTPSTGPHSANTVQQQRGAGRGVRAVRVDRLEAQQLKATRCIQRQQHASKTKALSRRRLDLSNKARLMQGRAVKPVSVQRRALQPSGQMNGRQLQGCQH